MMNAFIWYLMLDSCLSSVGNSILSSMRCAELRFTDGREFAEMNVIVRYYGGEGIAGKFVNGKVKLNVNNYDFFLTGKIAASSSIRGNDMVPWGRIMFDDVISVVWK